MTRKRAATALAGAAAVASVAYGVGTQAGGGAADAAKGTATKARSAAAHRGGPWGDRGDRAAGLAAMAKKMGVTSAELKKALDSLRPAKGDGPGGPELSALAKELGVSSTKLQAAFEKVRPSDAGPPPGGPPPGGRFDRDGDRGGPGPGDPEKDGNRPDGPAAAFAAALAKELGLKTADVQAAFKKVRSEDQATESARRGAFVKALANKLGISTAKVEAALGSKRFGPPGAH